MVFALAAKDGVVSAGSWRIDGGRDGMVRAPNTRSRLHARGFGAERRHGTQADGAAAGAQIICGDHALRIRQRRRHFWTEFVSRRDAWRSDWKRGASLVSGLRWHAGRLRP